MMKQLMLIGWSLCLLTACGERAPQATEAAPPNSHNEFYQLRGDDLPATPEQLSPNEESARRTFLQITQTIAWDEQGIIFRIPQGWRITSRTAKAIELSGGADEKSANDGSAFLSATILNYEDSFDALSAFNALWRFERTRHAADKVSYLRLDKAAGVLTRETETRAAADLARLTWQTYRHYGSRQQLVTLTLSARKDFWDARQKELELVLDATSFVP